MAREIGQLNVKVGLDSTGFQNGVSQLNRELRVVQSEFKAASASMGDHGKSLDGLKLKSESFSKQTEIQKEKIKALEEAHKKSIDTKGQDAKATQELEIKLNKAKEQLALMEQDLQKVNKEIEVQSSNWYKLGQSLEPVGKKMQDIGGKFQNVGKDLTKKVTVPLAGIGTAAIKIGMDFEESMSKVKAFSGASEEDMVQLEKAARDAGASTSKSAKEAADALGFMALAGWDSKTSMEALMPVLRLSEAGNIDLARASSLVTDSMSALGLTTQELPKYLDIVAQTARSSNTDIDQMAEGFLGVGGTLRGLDVPLEESALALGFLANAGVKGSEAGTALNAVLLNLTAPTGRAKQALDELGFSAFDSQGNFKGLENVLFELKDKLKGMTEEQRNTYLAMIGGKEHVKDLNALLNGMDDSYDTLTKDISEFDGALDDMANTMRDNNKGSIIELKSAMEELGLKIYDVLKPSIADIIDSIQGFIDKLNSLSPAQQEAIVKLGLFAAAIGPVLLGTGSMIKKVGETIEVFSNVSKVIANAGGVIGALTSPIGIAIAAIVAIVAVGVTLYKNWDDIKAKAGELKEAISEKWNNIKESTSQTWDNVKTTISTRWNDIKSNTNETIGNIKTSVSSSWENIKSKTNDTWENMKSNTASAWQAMRGKIDEHGGGIKGIIGTYTEIYKTVWGSALKTMDDLTGGKFSAMVEKVKGAFNKVKDSIQSGISKIKEWNQQRVENKEATFTQRVKQVFETVGEKIKGIGRNAEGTEYWRGGLTWVGERGPELVNLPRGSKVFSNEKSMEMIKGKGQTNTNNSNLTIHIDNFNNNTDKDIEQLAYELEFYRQRVAMGRGGI
ncbi:phage tail tape measure protein [Sporanaerobacter acetigenes]|uniref:Phage tail tape measure protein, TP901 family, core region n=1 Tax=Sporanaerobacter acetigenes DSM 13106 TaxID=1123281 RepID=A0A1M5Z0S5_9FIRM|nr:phage tail tape measure protein [Sporanaerobacter acetigenes]SHI17897.1 phage tail tape measure protein, TP901 family, core region [Sporanaerobacter acetigenes DSM 13106]